MGVVSPRFLIHVTAVSIEPTRVGDAETRDSSHNDK
jgi:hypothetical protein